MTTFSLCLYADDLPAKSRASLAPAIRVCYVVAGDATLRSAGQVATLAANSAWHGSSELTVQAGANGATLARFELVRAGAPSILAAGDAVRSECVLAHDLELGAADKYLIRCDRVDFPLGGIAYTHTHQGGGIRRLLQGGIRIETAGKVHDVAPGGAWFESGPDPVLAHASTQALTSFVRVMILPLMLQGKSSIRYVHAEDADKPKLQQYQLFVDDPLPT